MTAQRAALARRAAPVRHAPWGIALSLVLVAGHAQTAPPPSADASRAKAAGRDGDAPGEDAAFEGRVAAYLLSPDAGVAGLVFDDGRQVFVPPRLGDRLAALVQPGQQVRVGPPREATRGPASMRAITAVASGSTLADAGEGADDGRAPAGAADRTKRPLQAMQAAGAIRLYLHGPRGETNGLLLDTGTEIFFPPHVALESGEWMRPGRRLTVEGYGRTSAFGTVIQATRIVGDDGRAVVVYGPSSIRPR